MLAVATAGAVIWVEPRGQPRTARRCCSNCEVIDPSIVQWPELCGRRASSLISTPSSVRKNSTATIPVAPISSTSRRVISVARKRTSSGSEPGTRISWQIASTWIVSTAG